MSYRDDRMYQNSQNGYDDRWTYDDQRNYNGMRNYDDQRNYNSAGNYGDQRNYNDIRNYDDRRNYNGSGNYGDQRNYNGARNYDNRGYYDDRRNYDDLRNYNSARNYDDRWHYDDRQYYDNRRYRTSKSEWLASILSTLIIGAGQIYCAFGIEDWAKQLAKGFMYIVLWIILFWTVIDIALSNPAIGFIGYIGLLIWYLVMIKDAWNTAIDISEGCYCWTFVNLRSLNSGGTSDYYGGYPVRKNKWLAAIFSALFIGLGQIYCAIGIEDWGKQLLKGFLYMILTLLVFILAAFSMIIFPPLGTAVLLGWWVLNIVDAYHTAEEITDGCYTWSLFK